MATASSSREPTSPPGSKTPESITGCHSPIGSNSPIGDDACPICLGQITEKCAADSCFHNFCFVCLKEWSKQKPVCPLCKQSFSKILYAIKSETDYKEYVLPKRQSSASRFSVQSGLHFLAIAAANPHHMETFSISRHRRLLANQYPGTVLPNLPVSLPGHSRRMERASSYYRLSLYVDDLWVQPLTDITGQYRESSPDLYREQPALTHRLVPWVNREIAALVPHSRVSVVLVMIMDLIERYAINSQEFRRAVRPHLNNRTNHFIHEFYNFARSPYDMIGHDVAAQYIPHREILIHVPISDSDSTTEEDDIIEIPITATSATTTHPFDITSRPSREEIVRSTNLVPVPILTISSSDSSSESDFDAIGNVLSSSSQTTTISENIGNDFHSLDEPGPSGISSRSKSKCATTIKKEKTDDFSSDECLVVNTLRPKRERTPEIINLSTDEEEQHYKKSNKTARSPRQMTVAKSKNKKKTHLERSSFSLHFSGTLRYRPQINVNGSSDSSLSTGRVDHNYCTGSNSQFQDSDSHIMSDYDDNDANYIPPTSKRPHYLSDSSDSENIAKINHSSKTKGNLDNSRCRRTLKKKFKKSISERLSYSKTKRILISSDDEEEIINSPQSAKRRKVDDNKNGKYKSFKNMTTSLRHSDHIAEKRNKKQLSAQSQIYSSSSSFESLSLSSISDSSSESESDSSSSNDSLSVSSLLKIPISHNQIISSESEDISNICKTINRYNKDRFKNAMSNTKLKNSSNSHCNKISSPRNQSKTINKSQIKKSKKKTKTKS